MGYFITALLEIYYLLLSLWVKKRLKIGQHWAKLETSSSAIAERRDRATHDVTSIRKIAKWNF